MHPRACTTTRRICRTRVLLPRTRSQCSRKSPTAKLRPGPLTYFALLPRPARHLLRCATTSASLPVSRAPQMARHTSRVPLSMLVGTGNNFCLTRSYLILPLSARLHPASTLPGSSSTLRMDRALWTNLMCIKPSQISTTQLMTMKGTISTVKWTSMTPRHQLQQARSKALTLHLRVGLRLRRLRVASLSANGVLAGPSTAVPIA